MQIAFDGVSSLAAWATSQVGLVGCKCLTDGRASYSLAFGVVPLL
jgi:hypothetical protein